MMRMLLIVPLLLVAAGSLAGCGTYEWSKPGASDAEFKTDSNSCMAAGDSQFRACMTNLGWQYKDR